MSQRIAPPRVFIHGHSRITMWRRSKEALRVARGKVQPPQPSDYEQRSMQCVLKLLVVYNKQVPEQRCKTVN